MVLHFQTNPRLQMLRLPSGLWWVWGDMVTVSTLRSIHGYDGTEQNYITRTIITIPKTDGTILRLNNSRPQNMSKHWHPLGPHFWAPNPDESWYLWYLYLGARYFVAPERVPFEAPAPQAGPLSTADALGPLGCPKIWVNNVNIMMSREVAPSPCLTMSHHVSPCLTMSQYRAYSCRCQRLASAFSIWKPVCGDPLGHGTLLLTFCRIGKMRTAMRLSSSCLYYRNIPQTFTECPGLGWWGHHWLWTGQGARGPGGQGATDPMLAPSHLGLGLVSLSYLVIWVCHAFIYFLSIPVYIY